MGLESLRRFAAVAVCAAPLACGSGESSETAAAGAPTASGTPSQAAAQRPLGDSGRVGNAAPVITRLAFEPPEPMSGEPIRVKVDVNDPDGDRVRLAYTWRLGGKTSTGGGDRIVLKGFRKGERVEVMVVATDGEAESAPQRLETRIRNRPPSLIDVRLDPSQGVVAGAEIEAIPNADDLDGDSLRFEYEWRVNGSGRPTDGPVFATKGLKRGDQITVSVRASDGTATTDSFEGGPVKIGNTSPEITSSPTSPGPDGVFRYLVTATDPDRDRGLVFSLDQAPEGMTIDRTGGEVYWEPSADQSGVFPVAIVVNDRKGGSARQTFELTLAAPSVPASPAP